MVTLINKRCFGVLALFVCLTASAQCGIENTAFKSGEVLEYDLKFNWKLIWFTVGTATMDTKLTKFEGKDAWRSTSSRGVIIPSISIL